MTTDGSNLDPEKQPALTRVDMYQAWRQREGAPLMDKANGTAPFKLERWDRTGRYVLLTRHEGYWRGPAALKRVLIKSVPELATRKLMLQAGDADLVEGRHVLADGLGER